MSLRIKLLAAAALVLIAAAALTFINSNVDIDYCKGMIKLDGGYAVLNETENIAAVIRLDKNGKAVRRVSLPLNNPFTLSVRSVHDMFSDDNGNVYAFCTVYSPNHSKREVLYKCDFTLGIMRQMSDLSKIDGYTAMTGTIPFIDGGDIYIPMQKDDKTVDIVKISGDDAAAAVENICPDGHTADRIFYRDGVVFFEEQSGNVYADGNKIYPLDGKNAVCTGLNCDGGFLSFIDTTNKTQVVYEIARGAAISSDLGHIESNMLQHIMAYSDGTVTAAREDGGNLRAFCASDKAQKTYSAVTGGFSWQLFIMYTVFCAVAAAVLMLLYTVLFVRLRTKNSGSRRYQSIAARITAISTAAGIVCTVVFGFLINGMVKQLNVSLHNSIKTSSSQFFTSYILSNCVLETKDGKPSFEKESAEDYARVVEGYRRALEENNGIECDFILLIQSGDKLYCLQNSSNETYPAEYTVSLRALSMIEDGMERAVNLTFDDNMTSGMYKYACCNFMLTGNGGTEAYNAVICTVIDAYRMRQTGFTLYLWLIAVVVGLVIVLLIAANILLRRNLRGLKRLKKAFKLYENGGESSVFGMRGGDEIAETGQALELMTEGTRVHTRDISEGNRRYKRFMSAGILKLLGKSEISKVGFAERVSVSALIMRFTAGGSDIAADIKPINDFLERSGGVLLNFGGGKADICFTDEYFFCAVTELAAQLDYPSPILVSFGTVEAGSAGNADGAWLIGLSEEFAEFERLEKAVEGSRVICTAKAAEKLNSVGFSLSSELRSVLLGETEYFEVIPNALGGEDEHETSDNNYLGGAAVDGGYDPVV